MVVEDNLDEGRAGRQGFIFVNETEKCWVAWGTV